MDKSKRTGEVCPKGEETGKNKRKSVDVVENAVPITRRSVQTVENGMFF